MVDLVLRRKDIASNRLFAISKTTGNSVEIARDLKIKSSFDNNLTGKASFRQRKQTNKESSVPRLPLYLQRHKEVLKKYDSSTLNRSQPKER